MNAMSEVRADPSRARKTQLKFEIGARTLITVDRTLVRVPLSLADARTARLPALPPLDREAHGYAVTSLPEGLVGPLLKASGDMLPFVRQRYTRYYLDLTLSFERWFASLSSNTRQSLRRKAKKVATASGGELDIRAFSGPSEMEAFYDAARCISLRTYQERLLGSGLPDNPDFVRSMHASAAVGRVRAWLLYIAGEPAAYLYCPIVGDTVIYAYVGHDPAFNELSPGAVLQLQAVHDLFDEGAFATFDFTEGEGQHKRQFATGGISCVDLLLLRPSFANRMTMTALAGFDRSVAAAKRLVQAAGLGNLAKRVRRG
ncbi:CelD/BcsL family acetyltransferase involved in cellulose biosynthesis [Sphingomonas xinjiangensis]|uniref:CelD/BcsL family acetyltransferase involved in cellulose biosynthesis n=2 Tax=Sphingomonas xinjiangensis TaxID=643568 RepID=A0A840Y9Y8_9SPHN|nr:CelD/BcsL family acetyltransferase involved in cellulose biosynthesis [Sphingomonas xinjiangensis]